MKKSDYETIRRGVWAGRGCGEIEANIRTADDVEAAEQAGVRWDPEPEPAALPGSLYLSPRIVMFKAPNDPSERGWFIRDAEGGPAPLAIFRHQAFAGDTSAPERLLAAMVAAYNREREEEAMEAEHGAALDAGLSEILQDEMMAEINAGAEKLVQAERARCLAHVDWLLSCFPEGWDFARRMTSAASARIKSGAAVKGGEPRAPSLAWIGADQDPSLVPPEPPEPGSVDPVDDVEPVVQEERREEPRDAFPRVLMWGGRGMAGSERLNAWPSVRAEIDRRWKEEPRLRAEVARLSREKVTLQERAKVLGRERDEKDAQAKRLIDLIGRAGQALVDEKFVLAFQILTGKES